MGVMGVVSHIFPIQIFFSESYYLCGNHLSRVFDPSTLRYYRILKYLEFVSSPTTM